MAFNLLEAVRDKLGYSRIRQLDPNTQEISFDPAQGNSKFDQAVLSATLTALYKYSQMEEGAANLLGGNISTDWVMVIFGDKAAMAVERIADYSLQSQQLTKEKMNEIAQTAMVILAEHITHEDKTKHLKDIMAGQKNYILPYLPAALQMGQLLNESTLDDGTNKMEGPVSTFLQNFGTKF